MRFHSFRYAHLVVIVLMFACTAKVQAWGANGHRITGQIADWHLTEPTRQAIMPLLGGDKLAEVTTWADEMRSSPDAFWQGPANKWHYINMNERKDFKPERYALPFNDDATDVYAALLRCITVLQDDEASLETRQLHFRFLTHVVGDIHQPLHAGRSEDRGGNDIHVSFFGDATNLHSLWDTGLIESQKLSFTEFAQFIDTDDAKVIHSYLNSDIKDWIYESYALRDGLYNEDMGNLRWDYQFQYMPLVKERLLQAGIRMAGLLNALFDPGAEPGRDALTQRFTY